MENSLAAQLENKKAIIDFRLRNDIEDNAADEARRPAVTSFFKSELGNQRISARPIAIITTSDQDILHYKEDNFGLGRNTDSTDELLAIPVLPADEMDSLSSEIKMWKRNLKCVRIIFFGAFICALFLLIIAVSFSVYWFSHEKALSGLSYRQGTTSYNVHMCTQILNMFIMLMASMLFRTMPHMEMRKLTWTHAIMLQISYGLCLLSNCMAIKSHTLFTGSPTHFYSLHSWVGLSTFIFYTICLLSGWLFLCYPNSGLRARHAIYGKITFGLIGIAALIGYYERASDYKDREIDQKQNISLNTIWLNIVGVLLLVMYLCIRVALANFSFRRQPKPQWDVIVFRSIQEVEEIFVDVHNCYDTFELWVKAVNHTKMGIMQGANAEAQQFEEEDDDDLVSLGIASVSSSLQFKL